MFNLHEKCTCGASFKVRSPFPSLNRQQLDHWRTQHRCRTETPWEPEKSGASSSTTLAGRMTSRRRPVIGFQPNDPES